MTQPCRGFKNDIGPLVRSIRDRAACSSPSSIRGGPYGGSHRRWRPRCRLDELAANDVNLINLAYKIRAVYAARPPERITA